MEKAIIFSDLHVHPYRAFNEDGRRLKNCIAVIDYVFQLAKKNDIKYILMPGDLYDKMQILSTLAVTEVISCLVKNFQDNPNIQLIAVSGNHDQGNKNVVDSPAISALDHLAQIFYQFILLDKEEIFTTSNHNVITGIPYYEYPEEFREVLAKRAEYFNLKNKYRVFLLMHQTVASGLPIEDTIEPTDPLFDNFDTIFNGHIHTSQEVTEKFINVGSPLHRDAGDISKAKGIWLVDLDDPLETIGFKDLTTMFPQFIYKEEGSELTEWESKQYVIFTPARTDESIEEKKLADSFRTDLSPDTIMKNYALAVNMEQEKLSYGLSLLI